MDRSQLHQHLRVRRWTPEWARRRDPGDDVSEITISRRSVQFLYCCRNNKMKVDVGSVEFIINGLKTAETLPNLTFYSSRSVNYNIMNWGSSMEAWIKHTVSSTPPIAQPFCPPFTLPALCLALMSCLRGSDRAAPHYIQASSSFSPITTIPSRSVGAGRPISWR